MAAKAAADRSSRSGEAPAQPRSAAIVGRPNVGKSALFNRLAGTQIAIVHDQPGITRDRLAAECRLANAPFEIIDTGGIGADVDGDFSARVRAEAEIAIATAAVLLLVVDGRAGLTPLDLELAAKLRRAAKPVLLVVNKIDEPDRHAALADAFARLGFAETLPVSAAHGGGIRELVRAIEAHLPPPAEVDELIPAIRAPKLALVGRPNVGKSSLINALLAGSGGEESAAAPRTIVSEIAGTTRDAVDVPCLLGGKPYVLIDTAGIRHRGKRDNSAEIFSVMRSEKSIRRADLCVLVIDAGAGVTAQDRQIGGLIQRYGKPCIIAVNKWDLVSLDENGVQQPAGFLKKWIDNAGAELFFLPHAPLVALSARDGKNVGRLVSMIEKVRRSANETLATGPLNRLLRAVLERQPPPLRGGRRFKLLYATQVARKDPFPIPIPTFLMFVNDPDLLPDTYRKYMENALRESLPYPGLPLRFQLRGRDSDQEAGE